MRHYLGVSGAVAILALGACAGDEQATVATTQPAGPECRTYAGVYARVADARPVYYEGEFDPGYIAVTDTSGIGAGQPNAVEYALVTREGDRLPLVAREQYRIGDQLYVEPDSCDRARVTVIQELG